MATIARIPLSNRHVPQLPVNDASVTSSGLGTSKIASMASTSTMLMKRPRSPELKAPQAKVPANKRPKSNSQDESQLEKDRRRVDRDAMKEVFRAKYTKAFPSWTFYFDTTDAEKENLANRVLQLNARVARFFSKEVTHFITNRAVPAVEHTADKENVPKSSLPTAALSGNSRSPVKLRELATLEDSSSANLVKKAQQLGMKIWDTKKLDSVLNRCLVTPTPTTIPSSKTLHTLLESERRYGTTTERDPTQRRHDYHYFSKNCKFVLVEDMDQQIATIAAMEYPITKTPDGQETGSWPVPYCHPRSRGPFIEYNEKEERRMQKQALHEAMRMRERFDEIKKLKAQQQSKKQYDLRRSVSMNNLQRDAAENIGLGIDEGDSRPSTGTNASGFLVSNGTYVAASGNSVAVTSTYGTTSTAGLGSSRRVSQPLSAVLRSHLQNQITTSRRVSAPVPAGIDVGDVSKEMMPPPLDVPDRQPRGMLRKSKSTNTLRLPKREEGAKPGYCESCRVKFEDFKLHVRGKKHVKFAMNDANFVSLDYALARVKRPTITQVEEQNRKLQLRLQGLNDDDEDGDFVLGDEEAYPNDDEEVTLYGTWS